MHSFFRASHRISSQKLARSFSMKTNNVVGSSLQLNMDIMPHPPSKIVSNTRIFEGKWDQSQKHMMLGLGCSVYIDLCAEAMFFKKVPVSVYKESLEMVLSNEYVQNRIGPNISRKGNKFGVWPDNERGKKVLVAHYFVQGDKGDAKVVLKVAKQHLVYETMLLYVEFTNNSERLILIETPEEDPQPSILPAL